jgi:quercetin dioxygenase-like cupin family protein
MSFGAEKAHSFQMWSDLSLSDFREIAGIEPFLDPSSPDADYPIIFNAGRPVTGFQGESLTLISTAEETGGEYTLFLATQPPGTGPNPHIHSFEDEWFYFVEGNFEFNINGQIIPAKPGDLFFSDRGELHSNKSVGPDIGKVYLLFDPAGEGHIEDLFMATSLEALAGLSPSEQREIIFAEASKAGIEIILSNNIAAVPEPSLGILAVSAFGTTLVLKRKRKSRISHHDSPKAYET